MRAFPVTFVSLAFIACVAALFACNAPKDESMLDAGSARKAYALVIHGGAGTIPKDIDPAEAQAYRAALEAALREGLGILEVGGTALDAVQSVLVRLEDDPLFNAGRGAVFTHDGRHELDAAIMDGNALRCGAVAGLHTTKNPIKLARLVMERTRHVLLAGEGADLFSREMGLAQVDQDYFFTQRRYEAWQRVLARETKKLGTVGAAALDRAGNLAAGTSTGGLTDKRYGRVGDVPVIGAGTYANNLSCAVSCTGIGEEFIRHNAAHEVSALILHRGFTLEQAVNEVIGKQLAPGDGGLIAVDAKGAIAMAFSTMGMYRGAADSEGRFEVKIW